MSTSSSRKRKLADAESELVSRPSPYHPAVTLFELGPGQTEAIAALKTEEEGAATLPAPATPARRTRAATKAETPARTPTPRKAKPQASSSSAKTVDDITTAALETKHELDDRAVLPTPTKKKAAAAAASPRKQKPIQMELAVPHPAPAHWREVYDCIHKMREGVVAPVDTMGCHTPAEREEDPKVRRRLARAP